MSEIHPDLIETIEAVVIHSPERYAIRGETVEVPIDPTSQGDPESAFKGSLAGNLYSRLYIRPPSRPVSRFDNWLARRDFLATISAANSGQGSMEPGWKVETQVETDGGTLVVSSRGLRFWVASSDVHFSNGANPGETCHVAVPGELRYFSPGYYFALGNSRRGRANQQANESKDVLLRYYWNLSSRIASRFVVSATSILNEAEIPFELKVLSDPEDYTRADSGVLYVSRSDARRVVPAVAAIHERIADGLRPDVPLFTRKLADGLALAEDPAASVSFGQHRCEIVAKGLWQSLINGELDTNARASIVAEAFRNEGLDPRHPYFGVGSSLEDFESAVPILRSAPAREPVPIATRRPTPLEEAVRIGRTLCQSARWDSSGRSCNWMGRSFAESHPTNQVNPAFSAIGPDLYNGSAGIALFLAELHNLTGDPECKRTALAALSRSIRQAERRSADLDTPVSFYNGLTGLVYAADRVGLLTGDDSSTAPADALLERLLGFSENFRALDFLIGTAGAIAGMLALSRASGRTREAERALAIRLGEELLDLAERGEGLCTWNPEVATGPGTASRPLTGMSHGVSGIALALLELHVETGRADFLEAASGAFAYEDSVFHAEQCNWPDFRISGVPGHGSQPLKFARFWCHGAPGIALARLRASTVDLARAENHRSVARAAVSTTMEAIDMHRSTHGLDLSLCHGLAGLVEIARVAAGFWKIHRSKIRRFRRRDLDRSVEGGQRRARRTGGF